MKRSEALPNIRTAAVVGSGTMGGGIAALLAGVGIPTLLLDIAPGELTAAESAQGLQLSAPAVRNRIVNNGLAAIKAARPAALFTPAAAALLTVGNLQDDFARLAQVDWVIEVIIENLAAKRSFYERLEQVRPAGQLVTSNTSGLPIQQLARGRSADFRRNFCGTHFFNPPRYLKLLEVIPTADTRPALVQFLQSFGAQRLGKGVVLCKDTPNFIGNRIGGAANGFRMSYALDNGYSVEEADAIGGPLMGYPRTAVFRLMDLVGIDVAVMVSSNIARALPGDAAGGRADGPAGSLLQALLERKWLGNKTRIGFYKEVAAPGGGKEFWALDPATMTHTAPAKVRFESIGVVRKIADLGERLRAWVKHTDRAAQYVWHTLAFACSYSAARIPEISDDIASIDAAMRWGYMQQAGPFEYWDMLGVAATVRRMERDGYAVAPWVKKMLAGGHKTFYRQGARGREQYHPAKRKYVPVAGEAAQINVATLRAAKRSLQANLEAGLFDMGDGVLLLEFHGKANTLGSGVLQLAQAALQRLEHGAQYTGLVIGNQGELFSAGANIDPQSLLSGSEPPAVVVERLTRAFQDLMQRLRYCAKPVVAAPFDRTLGGGTEVCLAATRMVAHMELYMGLVETGVGLVPAGGGCKEMLRRVLNPMMRLPNADALPALEQLLQIIGGARVSTSAREARELGFLQPADRIVMDRAALLAEAKREVLHLAQCGYSAPVPELIYAAGRDALAALQMGLYQMEQGGYISTHDALVGAQLARVLCGGDLAVPSWVPEQHILDLERAAFVELMQTAKTMERIIHTLGTGKPLRN